jgi:hypothetical protein
MRAWIVMAVALSALPSSDTFARKSRPPKTPGKATPPALEHAPSATRSERRTKKKARPRQPDALDAIIADALAPRPAPPPRAAKRRVDWSLPHTLDSAELRRAQRRLRPRVMRCHARYRIPGMAVVELTIDGRTGRVRRAAVRGALRQTPTAACILGVVRAARFGRFLDPTLRTRFLYILRQQELRQQELR